MKEASGVQPENIRYRPNALQKTVMTASAMLFLGVGCGMPGNETSSKGPTPQPIPTPSGLTSTNCEAFMVPDWQEHKQIEFACPKKSEDPSKRTNVILHRGEDGAVRVETATFNLGQSKDGKGGRLFLKPGGRVEFQSSVDPDCNIVILYKTAMPSVSHECPK